MKYIIASCRFFILLGLMKQTTKPFLPFKHLAYVHIIPTFVCFCCVWFCKRPIETNSSETDDNGENDSLKDKDIKANGILAKKIPPQKNN